jgi:hypothetical protein
MKLVIIGAVLFACAVAFMLGLAYVLAKVGEEISKW